MKFKQLTEDPAPSLEAKRSRLAEAMKARDTWHPSYKRTIGILSEATVDELLKEYDPDKPGFCW